MKKLLTITLSALLVATLSAQVFAGNLNYYKWKASRGWFSCYTNITSIYGLNTYYRYQSFASSKGKSSDGAFAEKYETNFIYTPDCKAKDSRSPSGNTYHNTSVNDGYGWYGQSCFMTAVATSTLTRYA